MVPLDPESEIDVSPSGSTPQAPELTILDLASVPSVLGSSPTPPASIPRHITNHHINNRTQVSLAGCVWSANSCAYNTFLMLLFSLYRDSSELWRQDSLNAGPWFHSVGGMFEYLMIPANLTDPSRFSKCRDDLRTMLSDYDATTFPGPGRDHTSLFQVFEVFANNSSHNHTLSQLFTCGGGCSETHTTLHLPGVCAQSSWTNAARRVGFEYGQNRASVQLFLDLQIAAKIRQGADRSVSTMWQCSCIVSTPHESFSVVVHQDSPQCKPSPRASAGTRDQRRDRYYALPFVWDRLLQR
jgi:hypothetical protein